MSDLLERVKEECRDAGMDESDKLRVVLLTVSQASEAARETAEAAREAVKAGARGLTREGEAELVLRIQETVERQVDDRIELNAGRIAKRIAGGLALKAAGVGIGLLVVGLAVGRITAPDAEARSLEGAGFMAQIAELNDPKVLRDYCLAHKFDQKGATACPMTVWVKPPGK